MVDLTSKLISFTENILTYRKNRKQLKKDRQGDIHPIIDWLGAFLWAACFVFIVNQYFFQAYVIPSRSMESTLNVNDRLIVNKLSYGPELLPGLYKLPGFRLPVRADIITFENPEYISRGTAFDIASRLIFMLTLSVVDIDKDSDGKPAHHFLIKRAVGDSGDIINFRNGEIYIKPEGSREFYHEDDFKELQGLEYNTQRLLTIDSYNDVDDRIRDSIYSFYDSSLSTYYNDLYFSTESNNRYLSHLSPSKLSYYQKYNKQQLGYYIPDGWIMPLGDNRDNSKDGRYFGIVEKDEILGSGLFIFWPLTRIGILGR